MVTYPVLFGVEEIGTASVERIGLYYQIHCICKLSIVPVHIVASAERDIDLGLCVPCDDHLSLKTSIPIKQVGEGQLRFRAMEKRRLCETAVRITPNEPFQYIAKLNDAYFTRYQNEAYIGFKDQLLTQQDNDQNP